MLSRLLAAIVLPVLLVGVVSWGQQYESTRSASALKTEEGRVDLAALAGRYCSSDHMYWSSYGSLRLELTGGRYELVHDGDAVERTPGGTFTVRSEQATGSARLRGSVLELSPAPLVLPATYVPVEWGSRVYLVPEHEIPEFCSSPWEPDGYCDSSQSVYFVRTTDGNRPDGVVTKTKPAVCQARK